MKTVITTPTVDLGLRTLGQEERRQVHAWFDHLRHWDTDPFVPKHSHALPGQPGVFVLQTSSDLRIFFSMEGDTITILDVAKKQAILTTASPQGTLG